MEDLQHIEEIHLIGISLPDKTTNLNNQSGKDCGNLWQRFEKEQIASLIPNKLSLEILAVYHNYEGDHLQPFSYFMGCKVKAGTPIPDKLEGLVIPTGSYKKVLANGPMPQCIGDAWKSIWTSGGIRKYTFDFEVYDERSYDWNNAEVDIFISIK